MNDFESFLLKKAETRAAVERCNYDTVALANTRIRERLAEIKSQHEPLAGLLQQPMSERERMYAAAFYVVVGRLPEPASGTEVQVDKKEM